jgi:hypothetical protein
MLMKIIRSEAGKRGGWEAWRPGGTEKMFIFETNRAWHEYNL